MITRRSFVGILGTIPFLGVASRLNKPSIAGFQYYEGSGIINGIKVGEKLNLRAEPQNPYDEFAVEIFHGKTKLGYVPRTDNRHICRLLLGGVEPFVEVEYTKPEGPAWKAVKAKVYLMQS